MYNRDIIEKRFHQSVPEEDLAAFTGTLRGLLRFMSDMFPRSKIVWINVHPLNNVDLGAKHNWGGGYFQPPLDRSQDSVLFPPLFSQRRLAQHAQTLRQAAEEEGVDSLDVSHWLETTDDMYRIADDRTILYEPSTVLETQRFVQLGRLLGAQRSRPPWLAATSSDGRDDVGKAASILRLWRMTRWSHLGLDDFA